MSVMQGDVAPLESYKNRIEDEIEKLVLARMSSPEEQPAMALARDVLLAGGKRYRPILGILTYEACGGKEVDKVMENLAELGMEPIMSSATRRSHARTVNAEIQPADGINPVFEEAVKLLSEKVVKGLK